MSGPRDGEPNYDQPSDPCVENPDEGDGQFSERDD